MCRANWRLICLMVMSWFLLGLQTGASYGEEFSVVAKAVPDECFNGCGQPYIPYENGCPVDTKVKVNQQYLWGLTKWKEDVWVGTGPNIAGLGQTAAGLYECLFDGPPQFAVNVLEGAMSQYPGVPYPLRQFLGDWRPPEVWVYNLQSQAQVLLTPNDPLVGRTLGFRAAGASDGVVILAGPRRIGLGLNVFAFDAETREYLGSKSFPQYSSIRKFIVENGVMYTGVQTTTGRGLVLRWVGDRDNPFKFEVVGRVDNDAANLAVHNGRLFVAVWSPSTQSSLVTSRNPAPSGIWMSPPIDPRCGLTRLDARKWKKVWEVTDYEVEKSIVLTQGVGDLASFGGYLYWGTMNAPYFSFDAFVAAYGEPKPEDRETVIVNLRRATAVFRGRNFDGNPEIQLLYGEEQLPKYDPATATWSMVPNNGNLIPIYGSSGFGYQTNFYTWTMAVHKGKLYVGTFEDDNFPFDRTLQMEKPGGDLYYFADADSPAVEVTTDGFGYPQTFTGIRTMEASDEGLFAGSSGRANIHPDGGWKLVHITP